MGMIFDLQSYALYDGPGIRSCVYLKGCPLHCAWCHNPESQSSKPEMVYWEERCQRCGACVAACAQKALALSHNRVVRNRELCVACGVCAQVCPNRAMEKIGEEKSAKDIVNRVLLDKPFFDNSGGGVTISGGEPTWQADFLLELLHGLKTAGLHVALETSGYFPEDLIAPLAKRVDLFLYDLKHPDPEKHKLATGVSNDLILQNFSRLLAQVGAERIVPRLPLIPGFNTDEESISGTLTFLAQQNYHGPVHLLPHHGWAKGKYQRLGRGDSFHDPGLLSAAELLKIEKAVKERGLEPVIHG